MEREGAVEAAREATIVYDAPDGTSYCILHPIYSSPQRTRLRVGLCHVSIALLCFLLFLFAVLGHVLPYCQTEHGMQGWYVWARAWRNGQELPLLYRRADVLPLRIAGAATALLGLAAFLVASSLPSAWSRAESARVAEEADNARLRRCYASCATSVSQLTCRPISLGDEPAERHAVQPSPCSSQTPVPCQGEALGGVFEARERRRCRAIGRVATATAVTLLGATAGSVVTVLLLCVDVRVVHRHEEEDARCAAGLLCFALASLCGCVGGVALMSSTVSHVRPLRRSAALPPCRSLRIPSDFERAGEGVDVRNKPQPSSPLPYAATEYSRSLASRVDEDSATAVVDAARRRTSAKVFLAAVPLSASDTPSGLDKVMHRIKRRQE